MKDFDDCVMTGEITHECREGRYVQIVTPERLCEILDEQGCGYGRPEDFEDDDEWNVGG